MALTKKQLKMRRTYVGASDIPDIIGVGYGTADDLLAKKWWPEHGGSQWGEAAEWGNLLEPVILKRWLQRNPQFAPLRPGSSYPKTGIRSPSLPWTGFTPDAIVTTFAYDHVVQIKTTNARNSGDWKDSPPPRVLAQVQWEMAVYQEWAPMVQMGSAHVLVLIGGQDFRTFTVAYDPTFLPRHLPTVLAFYQRLLAGPGPADRPSMEWMKVEEERQGVQPAEDPARVDGLCRAIEEQELLAMAHSRAGSLLRGELTALIPPDYMGLVTDKYRVQLWRTGKDSVYLRIKRKAV